MKVQTPEGWRDLAPKPTGAAKAAATRETDALVATLAAKHGLTLAQVYPPGRPRPTDPLA